MTSLPSSFQFGSATSGQSVRDAIASYRRAQYLVAGSTASVSSDSDPFATDEESALGFADVEDDDAFLEGDEGDGEATPRPAGPDDDALFDWEEQPPPEPVGTPILSRPNLTFTRRLASPTPRTNERSPLLQKKISFTAVLPQPRRKSDAVNSGLLTVPGMGREDVPGHPAALRRRSSAASGAGNKVQVYAGQSTFGQTLFNSIAILLGIGMLSEPLAFAYAGWGMGTVLVVFYGFISCYTAKILARIILSDPRLRSYADIGRKAFGPKSTVFISILFCLELFAVSVILVTLYADSLNSLIPRYSSNTYKLWGVFLLIPTVFLPLSLLSYTSIFGILSSVLLVIVVFLDGVTKAEAPGSLWEPADTSFGIDNYSRLGVAFGLFMAGVGRLSDYPELSSDGPSLVLRPCRHSLPCSRHDGPERVRQDDQLGFRMWTIPACWRACPHLWLQLVATSIYTLIAWAGYRMFGNSVSEEISMDLLATPGYNVVLNQAALWMLVVSPLSKFALNTQPLNTAIGILLGLDRPLTAPEDLAAKLAAPPQGTRVSLKNTLWVLQRVVVTLASVVVSIYVPEFSAAMAFLGSFSAFLLCILGPIAAKVSIERRCGLFDGLIMMIALVMAVWGTGAAFLDV
ncbi:unnamed protein product [Mycena citricolor]|uniref:Amino acid transporter transmembrane domain-containing protein n=1 Tax=Mycena citricolor TaxID=2018698 RepID=A0AAD2JV67_9AGAR|nr:unnamed protein product [Mycena citricolor]